MVIRPVRCPCDPSSRRGARILPGFRIALSSLGKGLVTLAATLALAAALALATTLVAPGLAHATCDADHTVQGCCAGAVLRSCSLDGTQNDVACNTKAPNPKYGAYLCGHDKSTASLMACYTGDLIDYAPQSGNVWCPGFCLYGCTGDNCPGNCATDQTCNNGTCQTKACGHPTFVRPLYGKGLSQAGPGNVAGLKAACTSPVEGWGIGVRENGTLTAWGDDSQTTGIVNDSHVTSIKTAVQVACAQYHVTVLLADGTLVAWGGPSSPFPGYNGSPPGTLTTTGANVVAIAASDLATAALRSNGSLMLWGADPAGKNTILNGKLGFKAIAGGVAGFVATKTDGTLVVAATDGSTANNTFLPPPTGLGGVVMASLASSTALALTQDGKVTVWGSYAPGPPGDLKPCVAVSVGAYGNTTALFALQVDGTVRSWGRTFDPNQGGFVDSLPSALKSAVDALKGVNTLDPHGGAFLSCTGSCGAISADGCCDGDKVHHCSALGQDVATTCSAGTCGWQSSASDYECSTTGAPAPGGQPLHSCICVPSCKNGDGSTKQCGSDGCGGTCDKGSCDDGDPCTVQDKCSGEACVAGKPFDCSDNEVCTDDACTAQGGKATCGHTPNTAPCNDDNACTTGDSCNSGACQGGAALDCDDAKVCTDDACAPATGCQHSANSATCSDNDACTVGDACASSTCKPGAGSLDCDDGNACTVDSCDKAQGCKHANAAPTAVCDDGSNCTGADHCQAGKCTGTANVDCNDDNPCTSDNCIDASTCAPHAAILEAQACSDGNACHVGGKCASGTCSGLSPLGCDDGNPCTDDACDAQKGCTHAGNSAPCSDGDTCTTGDTCAGSACLGGKALNCDDKNPCTDDSCDKATGCKHAANSQACDDGSVCTLTDTCAGGLCVGSQVKSCDDGQLCTTDTCNALLGCQHANNSAPCNDGDACTKGDACWQGKCTGGATPSCNDGNSCTADSCDAQKGCVYKASEGPCSDGDPCSVGDTCSLGACKAGGGTLPCDDGKPCTSDTCIGGKGCVFTANSLPCDDGLLCTVSDTCQGGTCGGAPKACDDGNPCTDDSCDAKLGCIATPNKAACSDGNPCTVGDACNQGSCQGGAAKTCDDGNPCTTDYCSPTGAGPTGCYHAGWQNAWVACDDGNACTVNDHCQDGKCQGGNAACFQGTCDGSSGKPKCACPAPSVSVPMSEGSNIYGCCVPNCKGKGCGPDGCGGTCPNTCGSDETCSGSTFNLCEPKSACFGKAPVGTGCCDGDTLMTCSAPNFLKKYDCASSGGHCGWMWDKQAYGCTFEGLSEPTGAIPYACPGTTCTPKCAGKECGPDGCGGVCGKCATGFACDIQGGKCLNPCDGIAPIAGCLQGKLNGQDVLATCPSIFGKAGDFQQSVCAADKPVGWSNTWGHFICGGKDKAPADKTLACPVQKCSCGLGVLHHDCGLDDCGGSCGTCKTDGVCVQGNCCTPNCEGKGCGSDGCGGSCGTCGAGQKCLDNGVCTVPECAGMNTPWGECNGQTGLGGKPILSYCTDNAKVSINCDTVGGLCMMGSVPTCQANTVGFNGPGDFMGYDAQHCGTRPANKRCVDTGSACSCGPDCESKGNCCDDYVAVCGRDQHKSACGDKTCQSEAGETCETCSADCGACKDATAAAGPWQLLYPAYIEHPGQANAKAVHAIRPLDDVRPQGPPLPLQGLLAWLPGPDGAQTAPGTRVVKTALTPTGGVTAVSDGVQGQALSLVDGKGKNRGGSVEFIPDHVLPRGLDFSKHQAGGLTLAAWVRLSTAAQNQPNAIGSARTASSGGVPICMWSRPQSSSVPLNCGGLKIVAINAYYGEVEHPRFPPGIPSAQFAACLPAEQLGATYRCHDPDVQAMAEKACLGKSFCWFDPWQKSADPCSEPPYKPMKSTLVLQAVCDVSSPTAAASLVVDSAQEGRHLRLVGPGLPPLVTQGEIPTGQWVHLALTFAPHGGSHDGTVKLFVDGKPQAEAQGYTFPQFYAWHWGVARATDVATTSDGYLDPGANAQAPNLAGHFDLDDAALYDRPLTPVEIATLVSKPNVGTLRTWPALDPGRVVKHQLWASGGKPAAVDLLTPQVVDPGTGKAMAADFQGISVPGGHFSAPADGSDLDGLTQFTWAGWIRTASLASATTLLDLTQGGKDRVRLSVDKTCGGAGLRADLASGTSVTTGTCEHVLQAGTWAFVGYVQSGGTATLYLDGARLGSATVSGPLFDATGSGARTFQTGAGVDLGWSALYGRALAVDELNAQRSQGPAVWLDGGLYAPTGSSGVRPRDFGGFVNAGQTGDTGIARAFDLNWKPIASGNTLTAGVAVVPESGRFHAQIASKAGQVPARVYSYVGTVKVPSSGGTFPLVRHVVNGSVADRLRLVCYRSNDGDTLYCKVVAASHFTFGSYAENDSWTSATFGVVSPAAVVNMRVAVAFDDKSPAGAVTVVDPGGQSVTVSLGFKSHEGNLATGLEFFGSGLQIESNNPQILLSSPISGLVLDAASGSDTLRDTRLYNRVLSPTELREVVVQDCAGQSCAAELRACLAPADKTGAFAMTSAADLASCGGCTGAYDDGGVCRVKSGFRGGCAYGDDCLSGLCIQGKCRASSADPSCVASCLAIGRTCTAQYSGGFECSTQCAADFKGSGVGVNPVTGETGPVTCLWNPPKDTEDSCGSAQDCGSGVCTSRTTAVYNVTNTDTKLTKPVYPNPVEAPYTAKPTGPLETCSNVDQCAQVSPLAKTENVCAASTSQDCSARHMKSRLVHATSWDGSPKDGFVCEGCLTDTYQGAAGDPNNGKPLYVQGWSMLSPQACRTIYENYFKLLSGGVVSAGTDKYHADTDGGIYSSANSGDILAYPPNVPRLRRLLLQDADPNSVPTPEVLTKLELAGVGRALLDPSFKFWQYDQDFWPIGLNIARSEQLRLGSCARATYDFTNNEGWAGGHAKSKFFERDLNHPTCVENKFPNGTPCPPAGATKTYTRANAGLFCASGFCAADDEVCETGYQAYEETRGSARNDGNSGGGGNDLGAIALVQDSGALFRFDRVDETDTPLEQDSDDHRHILLEGHTKNSVNIFGWSADVLDLSISIVEAPGAEDEASKADVSKEFLICGVQPPSLPELPQASCGAVEFKDGEYQAPECQLKKTSVGVSATHTTKSKTKKGKELEKESGVEVTDGDVVPTLKYKIPIPLEECPEELDGFTTVFGRACFAKETTVGPVPFMVEAEIAPEAGVEFGIDLDSDTFEPAAKINPAIALMLEVKGGIGGKIGPVELFGGLKGAITLIELAFPVKFGFSFQQLTDGTNAITDLWVVRKVIQSDFELSFLKLALSLFFEVGVGPFKLELEYAFFNWDGIQFKWQLGEHVAEEYKVDFQWDSYATSSSSGHGGAP